MKLSFVLSKEFIELVRVNITASKATIIRLAERRYIWSNPKGDDITILECDVDRAVSIIRNDESHYDRLASIYTWLRANDTVVKSFANDLSKVWAAYRQFITLKGLEKLWAITGVYNTACKVEQEFKVLAEDFLAA